MNAAGSLRRRGRFEQFPDLTENPRFWALLTARFAIGLYLVELLANLLRPHFTAGEPAVTVLARPVAGSAAITRLYSTPTLTFWALIVGIVGSGLLQVVAARAAPTGRRARTVFQATLLLLLVPFALIPLGFLGALPLAALACGASTAFALWVVHQAQPFQRLPLAVLAAGFGWGALIAWGFARACTNLLLGTLQGYLRHGGSAEWSEALNAELRVAVVHVTLIAIAAEAAGVLLLLQLLRRQVVDVVTGMALGAAIGIGYNFTESVVFIGLFGKLGFFSGATGGFEFWIRQCVTLFGGHCAFGATIGAGFGIAVQRADRRQLVIGAGLLPAAGSALANEFGGAWISSQVGVRGGVLDTLIVSPGILLLVQAPALVLGGLLLRSGLRQRAITGRLALLAEVDSGRGAITAIELPVLADPALRLGSLVMAWRRCGPGTARALARRQRAQLDLAAWRRQRDLQPETMTERGDELRARVLSVPDCRRVVGPNAVSK